MKRWRLAVGLLAVVFYALLSHWLTVVASGRPWAVAALLGPLWAAAVLVAAQRRQLALLTALALVAVLVAAVVLNAGPADLNRLYLLQHAGIHALLGLSFALTLRRGHEPLISRMARTVHGGLAPDMAADMAAYCRRLTGVWVLYFGAMTGLSVWVYLNLAWSLWSMLANVITPAAIAALFVGEYLLRYWWHPEFERATLMDAVRAYRLREANAKSAGS